MIRSPSIILFTWRKTAARYPYSLCFKSRPVLPSPGFGNTNHHRSSSCLVPGEHEFRSGSLVTSEILVLLILSWASLGDRGAKNVFRDGSSLALRWLPGGFLVGSSCGSLLGTEMPLCCGRSGGKYKRIEFQKYLRFFHNYFNFPTILLWTFF